MFLGPVANKATAVRPVASKLEARATLAAEGDSLLAAQRDRLRVYASGERRDSEARCDVHATTLRKDFSETSCREPNPKVRHHA
jgi:hypothetical protein